MPPIVEGSRGHHPERTPDSHPRSQWPTKSPQSHCARLLFGCSKKRCPNHQPAARQSSHQPAEIDGDVRRRPESISSNGPMPRDVPEDADDNAGGASQNGASITGNSRGFHRTDFIDCCGRKCLLAEQLQIRSVPLPHRQSASIQGNHLCKPKTFPIITASAWIAASAHKWLQKMAAAQSGGFWNLC